MSSNVDSIDNILKLLTENAGGLSKLSLLAWVTRDLADL